MQTHTYLMLSSDLQSLNLTLAINHTIKPKWIILLASPDMQKRAKWLDAFYTGEN